MQITKPLLLFDGLNFIAQFAEYDKAKLTQKVKEAALDVITYFDPYFQDEKNCTPLFIWDFYRTTTGQQVLDSSFRHKLYPKYKGNRRQRNSLIVETFATKPEIIVELTKLGINSVEQPGLEADDLIAFACKIFKGSCKTIVSEDNDFLQLVQDDTAIFKNSGWIDKENFERIIGINPNGYLNWKLAAGDPSDNIPAVLDKDEAWNWALMGANIGKFTDSQKEQFKLNEKLIKLNPWQHKDALSTEMWRIAKNKLIIAHANN